MASTDFNSTVAPSSRGRLAAFFNGLRIRYDTYRVYRRTVSELQSLSNRELADLGVHRSGIHAIAVEAAYGK